MGFTMEDVMETLQIVKECGNAELHIDSGDLKMSVYKGDVGGSSRSPLSCSATACQTQPAELEAAPAAAATAVKEEPKVAAAPTAGIKKGTSIEEGLVPIKANVTSVFYRRPSPDEPPFVEVGSEVREDTVVCLLEVMKCFRQVTADVRGRVERICVESNVLVENGTILFLIRPG